LTAAAELTGFRFHDLRHTSITELAEAGAPDATLTAIAGHMTHHMLEHHSLVRMQAKREAAEKLSSELMSGVSESAKKAVGVNRGGSRGRGYVTICVTIGGSSRTKGS
jgi:hypothetical protein